MNKILFNKKKDYKTPFLCEYKKVLNGGIRKDYDVKADPLENINPIIPEQQQHASIDGRKLTIAVLDRSVLMIFRDFPILDTSLPYVN